MKREKKHIFKRIALMLTVVMLMLVVMPAESYAAEETGTGTTTPTTTTRTIRKGMDISQWNGNIDWKQVKAAGIDFAFIRVAYRGYGAAGTLVEDTAAITNLKAATAAGVDCGIYIYSQAINPTEAAAEATYAINVLKKSGVQIKLPVVIDFEYADNAGALTGRLYNAHLSKSAATDVILSFMRKCKALGYNCAVYASRSMLMNQMDNKAIAKEGKIWLAEWGTSKPTKYDGEYSYWQYSANGKVPGITTAVDLNYEYTPAVEATYTGSVTPAVPANSDVIDGNVVTYTPQTAATGVALASALNVRKGPSTGYASIGKIDKYTTFTINGTYGTWYRVSVKLNGVTKTGYINQDYVGLKSELPATPVLKPSTQTRSSIKLTWNAVSGASKYRIYRYNYSTKKYVKLVDVSGKTTSYTHTGLTANKKYKYKIRAYKMIKGKEVQSSLSNYRVNYTSGKTGAVTYSTGLTVYSGAGTTYSKKCKLNYNEKVTITATVGTSWYKILYDHDSVTKAGYVKKKYIKIQ